MKEIKAYIKPFKLDAVTDALRHIEGLTGLSVVATEGWGHSKGTSERHTAGDQLEILAKHVKVEVVCHDDLVEEVIEAIVTHAHTGLSGDGKIFVSPIEDAVKIASVERGKSVV